LYGERGGVIVTQTTQKGGEKGWWMNSVCSVNIGKHLLAMAATRVFGGAEQGWCMGLEGRESRASAARLIGVYTKKEKN